MKTVFLFFLVSLWSTPGFARLRFPAPQASPMSCKIEGKITGILHVQGKDRDGICSRYPCRAKVKILKVWECGSSVSAAPAEGEVIEVQFAYTLHSTAKLFPSMKTRYPGMKKGDLFTANVEQRLAMGQGSE